MSERTHGLDALIAARDANFLRLAATVLSHAGLTVETTADRLGRVERLLQVHRPAVLVLEADRRRILQIRARTAATIPRVAIVIAVEETEADTDGADAVVAKWGPPALLVDTVERARAGGGAPLPRLRLVGG